MAELSIEEPADGTIVTWFRGRHPCAALVRIDEFAERDTPLVRWFPVDEDRGLDEGPQTWEALCKGYGTDNGPFPLTVGELLKSKEF